MMGIYGKPKTADHAHMGVAVDSERKGSNSDV